MSLFSGITRSLINPMSLMQLAMGPAGWASLAMKTIGSQIAMNVIQRLGQQMGLPQPMIDLAQAAFANASGQPGLARQNISEAVRGFVGQMDLRPSEAGAMQRELQGSGDKSFDKLMEIVGKYKKKAGGEEEESGSFLVALAKAMGKVMDKKAAQIQEKSDTISAIANSDTKTTSEEGKKEQQKLSSETTLLQAYSQELSFISNAATTAIKSIGEAQVTLGRK
jgi:hypothetical protein